MAVPGQNPNTYIEENTSVPATSGFVEPFPAATPFLWPTPHQAPRNHNLPGFSASVSIFSQTSEGLHNDGSVPY